MQCLWSVCTSPFPARAQGNTYLCVSYSFAGPIIDSAIPAIETIFSKDNTAPNAGEDPKPPTSEQLNAPILVELKQQQGNIEAILKTGQGFQNNLNQSFEDLKKEFEGKLDMNLEETLKALAIDKYDELFTVVRDSV